MATSTAAPTSTEVPGQAGVLEGMDPSKYNPADPIVLFIIQATIIIVACRLLHWPLSKLRQPTVIAEVVGGIVLGKQNHGPLPQPFPSHESRTLIIGMSRSHCSRQNSGVHGHFIPQGIHADLIYGRKLGLDSVSLLGRARGGSSRSNEQLENGGERERAGDDSAVRSGYVAQPAPKHCVTADFLGCALAYGLYHEFNIVDGPGTDFGVYLLFIGVAMAITVGFPSKRE
jgi:hypothetical protein